MTEREVLVLLVTMGYTTASSRGRTVDLTDLLDGLTNEGSQAVIDFWPSHINVWLTAEIDNQNSDNNIPWIVIPKKH